MTTPEFEGKVVVVTGASKGLGRAMVMGFARAGADVVISSRSLEACEKVAEEVRSCGRRALTVACHVGDWTQCDRLIEATVENFGRLDVLVNNAGGQYFAPAEAIATKGWRAVWRLNVEGMLNMSHAAHARAFAGGRGGTIVNVTLSPHNGMPGMAHSGAARATVEALTRELAERWREDGVSVSAVAAGHFETEVLAKYPASVRAGASRSVPLGRLGTAQEHAWLVALLASPLGAAFTGSTVTLDGARDNWYGPWPPSGLADESGEVPVEARKGSA